MQAEIPTQMMEMPPETPAQTETPAKMPTKPAAAKPSRKQRTSTAGKLTLGIMGLVLFAAMGYLIGTFFLDMHIHLPWYLPH